MSGQDPSRHPPVQEQLLQLTELIRNTGQQVRECRQVTKDRRQLTDTRRIEKERQCGEFREKLRQFMRDNDTSRDARQSSRDTSMAEILEELSRAEEDFISQIMAFAQDASHLREEHHRQLLTVLRDMRRK
ncbi:hypothetical protein AcW1_010353 [Taiwanofungus camphoratus]|nr:hypothetical protein AcW2_010380 [Antrodia cinnamomea]KAI0927040.1 hypothetical protein AcV5_010515 [Antrodia cinnamomea]KAI0947360.1 hypothetical protein AcV7_010466 [Antrodia cinnamomea]KAI0953366.1 hypothetical protein AcW1_010353 [Antrodia cinnamomea]